MTEPPLESWQDAIESFIRSREISFIQRVVVLRETGSTQEAARAAAGNSGGTLVIADRQTAGRGRLGRVWIQGSAPDDSLHSAPDRGLGLATTIALVGSDLSPPRLSMVAGLAAHGACAPAIAESCVLGLRWPNDVVEREGEQRKVAGILVEKQGKVVLVGFGINVRHDADDFPATLAGRAVSLRQLGSADSRLDVLLRLIAEMQKALRMSAELISAKWSALDILVGSRRTMIQAGKRYEGLVRSIQPTSHIEIETKEGIVQLPSLTTALVHDEHA
ncbi:MAG: biotin--[acetyl-CoA-carboxylase] ligase [Phycisphaeraceae bacterium]|nr:biotin--[acetyl-CoA-carboxylase] ligase [Phycisphaeraceae bacterium]